MKTHAGKICPDTAWQAALFIVQLYDLPSKSGLNVFACYLLPMDAPMSIPAMAEPIITVLAR